MIVGGENKMGRINVNVLLCEKCNDDSSNICNIFNAIKLNKENRASFTMVTQVNSFNEEYDRLGLFYFMEKFDDTGDGAYIYLGRIFIKRDGEEEIISTGESRLSTQNFPVQEVIPNYLKNVAFLGVGQYEIQVFLYKDGDIPKIDSKATKEQRRLLRNKDNLIAIYDFEAI